MKISRKDYKDISIYKLGNRGSLSVARYKRDYQIILAWKNNKVFDAQHEERPLYEQFGIDVDSLKSSRKLGVERHFVLYNTEHDKSKYATYGDRVNEWVDNIQKRTDIPKNFIPWLRDLGQRTLYNVKESKK